MIDRPRHYTTMDGCSCPDSKYRPWRRPCKHVRRLRAAVDPDKLSENLQPRGEAWAYYGALGCGYVDC